MRTTLDNFPQALWNILNREIPKRLSIALDTNLVEMERKYNNAVSDWKDKPRFYRKITLTRDGMTGQIVAVGTEDAKLHFLWTDRGTKPHTITAKNAPLLVFQTGFSPRTAPIARAQAGSGKASGDWVAKKSVQHPGTAKRQFTTEWVKQQTPVLLRTLRTAIKTAVRR